MRILRAFRPQLGPAFVIVLTIGCSGGGKTQQSNSHTPNPAGLITLDQGEATAAAAHAPAGAPDSSDAGAFASLDVAGVRLGMTPEQAIAALKAFDSSFVLSKRYLTDRDVRHITEQTDEFPVIHGQTGEPEECAKTSDFRLFSGILAAESTAFIWGKTNGRGYLGCWIDATIQPADEPKAVYVCLSPELGNHRVIGVALRTKFKTPTKVESVLDSVLKKYPSDFTASYSHNAESSNLVSYQCRFWRFDARGRTMSETVARQSGLLGLERSYGELPSQVREGAGVGIDLQILASGNHDLAQEFGIALYDESALYDFNGQAKAAFHDEIHQKQLGEETEKPKQLPGKM
jgi:hypothetical protein